MKRERNPQQKRSQILDATHRILRKGGYFMNFSLDKVAQAAGVSKGGLMHHFATKDALLRAAALDTIEKFERLFSAELETIQATTPNGKGSITRAYVNTVLNADKPVHAEASPLVLSYLNHKEGIDQPNRFETWQTLSAQDDIDVVTATIVRFAVDGILYTELIDNRPIPAALKQQILGRLQEMIAE